MLLTKYWKFIKDTQWDSKDHVTHEGTLWLELNTVLGLGALGIDKEEHKVIFSIVYSTSSICINTGQQSHSVEFYITTLTQDFTDQYKHAQIEMQVKQHKKHEGIVLNVISIFIIC